MKDEGKTKAQLIEDLQALREQAAVDAAAVQRQLAVERLRIAAMEMRSTDDLHGVVGVAMQVLHDLGIAGPAVSVTFVDEPGDAVHHFHANPHPRLAGITGWTPDRAPHERWVVGDAVTQYEFRGPVDTWTAENRQRGFFVWGHTEPHTFQSSWDKPWAGRALGLSVTEEQAYHEVAGLGEWSVTDVPFRMGLIGYRERQHDPAHDEIVGELADGLELGFRRFLDFRKLEAEAERSRIERAAERIRSEAMAMRGSEDLYALAATFLTEVHDLGIKTWYLSLAFVEQEEITTYCWALVNWQSMGLTLNEEPGRGLKIVNDDVLIHGFAGDAVPGEGISQRLKADKIRAFQTQQVIATKNDTGDMEGKRSQVLRDWTGTEHDVDRVAAMLCEPERFYQVPFSHGTVGFCDPENREESTRTLGVLAESFSLGYLRFLDFQRLEEQNQSLAVANERIRQANINKSQFLRRMSHDLRSPMNAIIGYSRLLQRRLADRMNEREARNLMNIETSSNNLLNLINDILDLSRIEAGRIEIAPQSVDVRVLANECADALESIVREGVTLHRDLENVDEIRSDPDRLRQVVMNLLGNATKFTNTGSITLVLRNVHGAAELSVADTGVGIPPKDLPHIFDEFRQVERQGGEQTEGTGLGLAIAKKTVDLLGGTLAAQSEVGVGTTFTVRIGDYSEPMA